jgi:hypothetical protein
MKVQVNFTLEIYHKDAYELSETDNQKDARLFFKGEAQDLLTGYLKDNGVRFKVLKDACDY